MRGRQIAIVGMIGSVAGAIGTWVSMTVDRPIVVSVTSPLPSFTQHGAGELSKKPSTKAEEPRQARIMEQAPIPTSETQIIKQKTEVAKIPPIEKSLGQADESLFQKDVGESDAPSSALVAPIQQAKSRVRNGDSQSKAEENKADDGLKLEYEGQ